MTTLIASCLALLAAGLAPRVFSPGLASIQSAVRERPEIEGLLMLASIVAAGALLVGGVLGDADGRKRVMMIALGGLVATGVGGLFVTEGPFFLAGRFVDVASASIVLPLALAGVATRYEGATRATAIGFAYAAYGAATAAAPVLLTLLGPTGSRVPAFGAAAVAAIIAFVYSRRQWHDLPTAGPTHRAEVLVTAVWAFGIVVITAGLIGFQGKSADAARVGLVLIGVDPRRGGVVRGATLATRRPRGPQGPASPGRHRPVRRVRHRLCPDRGAVPGAALLPAHPGLRPGPVGDRHDPVHGRSGRGGTGRRHPAVPFPPADADRRRDPGRRPRQHRHRGHPSTGCRLSRVRDLIRVDRGRLRHRHDGPDGDHLRERAARASGDGRGAQRSVGRARQPGGARRHHGPGHDPGARHLCRARSPGSRHRRSTAAVDAFRTLLAAINMPAYGVLVGGIEANDAAAYAAAYTEAVRTVMFSTGILTLLAAPIAWVAIGGRDPLDTVWQHQDEREVVTRPGQRLTSRSVRQPNRSMIR